MNPQYPITDEILSAFLDGELTEDERKQVEDWLETSPEARQQLEDLTQIGSLIRSIPKPVVPTGFQPAVMQRVQAAVADANTNRVASSNESGVNGRHTVATPEGFSRAGRQVTNWVSRLVSLAAVMGLILAVGLFLQNQQARNDVAGNLELDQSLPTASVSLEADAPPLEADGALAAGGDVGGDPEVESWVSRDAPAEVPLRAQSDPGMRGSAEPAPPGPPTPSPAGTEALSTVDAAVFPPNGMTLQEWVNSRPDPAIALTPGEMRIFLSQIGGQAVLVEFICVDVSAVDHTSDQLQVLLMSNGIHPVAEYGAPIDPDALRFDEGEQVVIYVESDESMLATALTQMDELEGVVNMNINNLVEYEVADGNVRDLAYDGLNRLAQEYGAPQFPPMPGNAAEEPQAEGSDNAPSPQTDTAPPVAAGEPAASSDTEAPSLSNRFVAQTVPQDVVDGLEQQSIISNSSVHSRSRMQMQAQVLADNFDRAQQPAEGETTGAETSETDMTENAPTDEQTPPLPVQLIFVVRPQGPLPAAEAP